MPIAERSTRPHDPVLSPRPHDEPCIAPNPKESFDDVKTEKDQQKTGRGIHRIRERTTLFFLTPGKDTFEECTHGHDRYDQKFAEFFKARENDR